MASTSIPGVFPSQRIPLYSFRGEGETVRHDFVDGGVLNNAPIHVAIDAGATHVISLELNALHQSDPLKLEAHDSEPSLPKNVIRTFTTMLDNASEDIRKAADVNKDLKPGKREVKVYRVAPLQREVDLVDFDGHYESPSPFAPPSVNLVDWMEQGKASALNSHVFWDATREEAPKSQGKPPDTCELCGTLTRIPAEG